MRTNKQKSFFNKTLSCAIATTVVGLSTSVIAEEAKKTPADLAQQGSQSVASNPFGAIKNSDNSRSAEINYDQSSNIDGTKKIEVPLNTKKLQKYNNPNPVVQTQNQAIPEQPPSGLPLDYQQQIMQSPQIQRPTNNDPTESVIGVLNASDEKIRKLNKDLYNKGRVINEGPVGIPKSHSGPITAYLSPGSTSPVIRLFKNRTSTLIITDMTGQPWPITNYDGLSEEDFSVKRLDAPSPDGYVLSITPKGAFVSGNLVVILKGLITPLNIEFVSAQPVVDVSAEIRVQAKGPNTQLTSVSLPSALDTSLLSILQGISPLGSKELKVSSNAVQAWLAKDGFMYVRTRYKIMSPAFDNVTSSPDGTYAYKMIPVPVVLFKVSDGRFGEFSVDGF
jgi:intracellular multiplication protein IcmK